MFKHIKKSSNNSESWNKKEWQIAEELAVKYLKEKGYKILEKNFKTPYGEIDIIANKKDIIIFVEVKSGKGIRIQPSERVDDKKYLKIVKSAEFYLEFYLKNKNYKISQIDVIEIINGNIKHYENVGWDFT
ncbi:MULTISPECIES: YraN family protein [Fervidobacterium]|nr:MULTISPECIES: YraN family protein [Fervidobacterium]